MNAYSRRDFTKQTLGSLLTFSLLETLTELDLFAAEIKPVTARWLADVNQVGLELKDQKLKQIEWQKKIEELFARVELADLLRMVDFDKLTSNLKLIDNGAL